MLNSLTFASPDGCWVVGYSIGPTLTATFRSKLLHSNQRREKVSVVMLEGLRKNNSDELLRATFAKEYRRT